MRSSDATDKENRQPVLAKSQPKTEPPSQEPEPEPALCLEKLAEDLGLSILNALGGWDPIKSAHRLGRVRAVSKTFLRMAATAEVDSGGRALALREKVQDCMAAPLKTNKCDANVLDIMQKQGVLAPVFAGSLTAAAFEVMMNQPQSTTSSLTAQEASLEALDKRRALLARLLTSDVLLSEGATVDDVKRGVADVVSAYGSSDSPTKSCPLDSFISCLDQPVYISLQHVDVTLVASQAGVTRGVAREALLQNDLDIVSAILGLTM